jgi:hypothetical protein
MVYMKKLIIIFISLITLSIVSCNGVTQQNCGYYIKDSLNKGVEIKRDSDYYYNDGGATEVIIMLSGV